MLLHCLQADALLRILQDRRPGTEQGSSSVLSFYGSVPQRGFIPVSLRTLVLV